MKTLMECASLADAQPRASDSGNWPAVSRGAWAGLLAAAVLYAPASVSAQELPAIVKIEEDWSVEVGVPSPDDEAPQITTVMSPTGNLAGHHCVFELNHRTLPGYTFGGMQLQCWSGGANLTANNFPSSNALATANEAVTYTLKMALVGTNLQFEVVNGSSTTWGSFGGQGYLKSSVGTSLNSFGSYSPETSVKNSRIGFASHRVKKFALKQVRYYSASGLVATDTTERVVHVHTGQ